MPKFFNYGEKRGKYDCNFKKGFSVTKKMDGSLIQVFLWDGNIIVSSKGSFHSDQANWASKILLRMINTQNLEFKEGLTYSFELIHPENRIVCNYGYREDLTLLSVRDSEGRELNLAEFSEFNVVETISLGITKYKDLKEIKIPDDEEGYVILFDNGNRVKIKGDEYCRLHRIVTNTTSYDIYDALKNDLDMSEMTDRVPDEFLSWYFQTVGKIHLEFRRVQSEIDLEIEYLTDQTLDSIIEREWSRKDSAKIIKNMKYKSELFLWLDGRSYDSLIWDRIKPDFEKAFNGT